MDYLLIIGLGVATIALAFLSWRFFQQAQNLKARYSPIADVEAELKLRRSRFDSEMTTARAKLEQTKMRSESETAASQLKLEQIKLEQQRLELENERRREQLNKEYEEGVSKHKHLAKEVSLLEENLEDISFGVYKPHFSFQSSQDYKEALERLRNHERRLIRDGMAVDCQVKWTVSGSGADGQRMAKQYTKLLIRAFNGECDATIANVSWNNIVKMEERVRKSFEALNELGGTMQMSLTEVFLDLKINELRLTNECEDKRYQEREEQRVIRETLREEEKARREIEKAREEAEREEERSQKALDKARDEALKATGTQLEKLSEQIKSLESKLDEAHQNKERAVSRAQLTKSGFVYVISNTGSFGERIVKVGMTRRMEPMERIAELGDASVPFPFDLHAMLYSDNAPELESTIHELLADRRVNLVNTRKEFFRDVDIGEIETFVKRKGLSAQFIRLAEAKEYRETLSLRAQVAKPAEEPAKFPEALFSSAGESTPV